jgi:KUP system potassium uptake protein
MGALIPMVVLATAATVNRQPSRDQWGLLPVSAGYSARPAAAIAHTVHVRDANRTDLHAADQWLLYSSVVILTILFGNSANLASAYGIAVTATMVVDALLAYIVVKRCWHWRNGWLWHDGPFLFIEGSFLAPTA